MIADGYPRKNRRVRADPDVASDTDGRGKQVVALLWIDSVIERRKHDIVPNQRIIAYGNTALILKTASAKN